MEWGVFFRPYDPMGAGGEFSVPLKEGGLNVQVGLWPGLNLLGGVRGLGALGR